MRAGKLSYVLFWRLEKGVARAAGWPEWVAKTLHTDEFQSH
jgi:hypothetical protein